MGRPHAGEKSQRPALALHEQLDMLWQSAGWREGSPSFDRGDWSGYTGDSAYAPLLFGV